MPNKVYRIRASCKGGYWHSACYFEAVKSLSSPIRGGTIEEIHEKMPARESCPGCKGEDETPLVWHRAS